MFNLESSITNWREKMFAAGISAAALDELESHLREEIDRQLHLKLSSREAFTLAVEKIGPANALNHEFGKNPGLHGFSFRRFATAPGILAILWLVCCTHDLMLTVSWVVYSTVQRASIQRSSWPDEHPHQWSPACAGCLPVVSRLA